MQQKCGKLERTVVICLTTCIIIIIQSCYSLASTGSTVMGEKELASLNSNFFSTVATTVTSTSIVMEEATPSPAIETERTKDSKPVQVRHEKKKAKKSTISLKKVKKSIKKDMDLSKPSGLSQKDFVKLVDNMEYDYTGVFKRNAKLIWKLAHKYQFNEIFFLGIVANESWWGSSEPALETNNYTSQMKGGKLIYYSSEEECFRVTAKNLGNNYLRRNGKYYNGTTLRGVNICYCVPGKHEDGTPYTYKWSDDVYKCMKMIL